MRGGLRGAISGAITLLIATPLCGQTAASVELVVPESEGGLYGAPLAADRDSSGRTWLIVSEQLPMLFSGTGEFMGRVRSEGQGPSEFKGVSDVAAIDGDSVAIVDVGNSRVAVWSSTSRMQRTIAIPFSFSSMVIEEWPARVWVSGHRASRGTTSLVYRLDLSGTQAQIADSLPLQQSTSGGPDILALRRDLSLTGDTLWVMTPHAGSIQGWRTSGAMESEVGFHIPWFGDPVAEQSAPGPRRLTSNLDAHWFDAESGEYSVFGRTGDHERYAQIIQSFIERGATEVRASEFPSPAELYWSHRIRVSPNGQVISDERLNGLVVDVTGDGRAVRVVADSLGRLRVFLDPLN